MRIVTLVGHRREHFILNHNNSSINCYMPRSLRDDTTRIQLVAAYSKIKPVGFTQLKAMKCLPAGFPEERSC